MIRLDNITFKYNDSEQNNNLSNINLQVKRGEVVLLCGESGCGKTTITRLLNGLVPHFFSGEIIGNATINDIDLLSQTVDETARTVGSVFQNPRSQFFNVDTTSELAFGLENMGLPVKIINSKMEKTIKDFNMSALMDRNIFMLSGGEKQKIACASASVYDPMMMVLDEPSSNLDTQAIGELRNMIALWKKQGKTVIIAEHRLHYLYGLADRIIYLQKGQIVKTFDAAQFTRLSKEELSHLGLRSIYLNDFSSKIPASSLTGEPLTFHNFFYTHKKMKSPALQIPQLELPANNIIAVIGRNGAGKSTFVQCLCGLSKGFKGTLHTGQQVLTSRKRIAQCYMVMQDVNHQLFTESVLDEVLLSMKHANEKEAERILTDLDLLHLKEVHPMSLSGGQKQRVAIAGAIASDRTYIVFDEPTSGLDLRHMREVSNNIRQLQQQGKNIFIITHDLELINECCTYILHLDTGRVSDSYPLDADGYSKVLKFWNHDTSPGFSADSETASRTDQ